ncbi:hypothetical protein AHAS_Ahas09G0140500 [Arachis hypogaea]
MFQGLGCSPIKAVRELRSERRETVRSISGVDVRALRGPFPSTRGSGRTHLWCASYRAHEPPVAQPRQRWVLCPCGGWSERSFENSREGHGEKSRFSLTIGVEEPHQSIPNLVVKLYCGDDTAETGEIKGHYLNATAGTCEEMIKRAVFARELGAPIVMHDYLTGGFTANTSLAHYCRDNGLLHIHRAMHAVIDRQKNHGMHFRVLAKALRLSGGDHIHAGTVVGKL